MTPKDLHKNIPIQLQNKVHPRGTNHVADCLSRLGVQRDSISLPKLHVHQITS